jgi:hypothetical protein
MSPNNKMPAINAATAGKKMPSGGSRRALGKRKNRYATNNPAKSRSQ